MNHVMTQVWCSLVYCILRWIFCILFCTAKHLLSVCLLCSCGSSTVSLGVSLLAWRSVSSQLHQYRKKSIATKHTVARESFDSTQGQLYWKYTHSLWETVNKECFLPATTGGNIPLALMNSSLWAPRDPGGRILWLVLPAVLLVNGGNRQEHSSSATKCPAACLTTQFITITIRVLWGKCVNLSRDLSWYVLAPAQSFPIAS